MFSYNLCALKYEEIKCKKTATDFIKSGRVKDLLKRSKKCIR